MRLAEGGCVGLSTHWHVSIIVHTQSGPPSLTVIWANQLRSIEPEVRPLIASAPTFAPSDLDIYAPSRS